MPSGTKRLQHLRQLQHSHEHGGRQLLQYGSTEFVLPVFTPLMDGGLALVRPARLFLSCLHNVTC